MEAYCVKCKSKKVIANPVRVTMKNNKPAMQGTCPDCGTKLTRLGT
ncbi:MAG: DUF5679 domain-containing protein [Armatimonadota bacterium]